METLGAPTLGDTAVKHLREQTQHVDQWMQELDYNREDVKDSVAAKSRADLMSMVAETESDESDEEGSARVHSQIHTGRLEAYGVQRQNFERELKKSQENAQQSAQRLHMLHKAGIADKRVHVRPLDQWEDAKIRVKRARALHQQAVGLGSHTDPSLGQDRHMYYATCQCMDGCKRSLKKLDWD